MEWLLTYPWKEVLMGSTLILGCLMSLLLLINKYPASRHLGQLCLSYLLLLCLSIFAPEWMAVGITGIWVSIFLYCKSFFEQKRRISYWHFLSPSVMGLAVFLFLPNRLPILIATSLFAGFYSYRAIRLVHQEGTTRGIYWFSNPGSRMVWFRNFISINILFGWLLLMPGPTPILLSLVSLLQWFLIGFQLVRESAFLAPIPVGNKYQKSTLSPAIKASILGKLNTVMDEQRFFLRDDVSLSTLANELGATTHHLSQVLNESKRISFQDLIAQYRIREASRLLRDTDHQQVKIENIATMVGYNSKSAFNTAFKRRTGHTPSEYRNLKHVRTYREERLPDRKKPLFIKQLSDLYHTLFHKPKTDMVLHFLKSFYRNLKRNKVFSLINLSGLTLGFTCGIFIYLFIADELSYDRSIPDHQHIYRVDWINENPQTRTPHPMAHAMMREWPEIASAVSLSPWFDQGLNREKIRVENVKKQVLFEERDFFFADSLFFEVFGIQVLEGDPRALYNPWTLVITEEMAQKYFGEESAIGQELHINDMPMAVTTVVRGMPENSHFHFQAILSYMTLKTINPDDDWMTWADFGHYNYVKAKPGVSEQELEAQMPQWILGFLDWGQDYKETVLNGTNRFDFKPITDIHLKSHVRWELENNGNILYVYILSATLGFILLIAAINYVNLTTAKSMERAKEIGIRKTLGAVTQGLSTQFYVESILFCLTAMILALALASGLLDGFNALAGKDFGLDALFNSTFIFQASAICIGIGLLSGLYPAIVLSSFRPTEVLKGKLTSTGNGIATRGVLVVVQFMVSAMLIAGSFIILRQLNYMQSKELGFDQEAIIHMTIPVSVEHGDIELHKVRRIEQEALTIPGVRSVSAASSLPGSQFNQHPMYPEAKPENRIDASEVMIDFGLKEVLNYEMAAGRDFNQSYAEDSAGVSFLFNETAIRQMNLEDPIGEKIVWLDNDIRREGKIVGVVKDFHFRSLHEPIQPLIFQIRPYDVTTLVMKLDGKNFQSTLSAVESLYTKTYPGMPFAFQFLDVELSQLYDQEIRTLLIFSVFTGIALVLACLGLLGMALALLHQRIKEIGMRKILGASPRQIMQLVLGQFMKLVLMATLIGLPVGYTMMRSWLNEFSYQTSIGLTPFIWSALILALVAVLSVASAVAKMAFSRPADSLRYE